MNHCDFEPANYLVPRKSRQLGRVGDGLTDFSCIKWIRAPTVGTGQSTRNPPLPSDRVLDMRLSKSECPAECWAGLGHIDFEVSVVAGKIVAYPEVPVTEPKIVE